MQDSEIRSLADLNEYRTAPDLTTDQYYQLAIQLRNQISLADWFTVGIMAPTSKDAISTIRKIEQSLGWVEMNIRIDTNTQEPVFLKANQKTGDIYIRVEYGLGEGILITSQKDIDDTSNSSTYGPFPLDFFTYWD